MRLTVKITFAVLLGVALIFSAYSYFSIQREREQLKKNLSREARHIGESLRYLVTELWQERGEEVAIAFLKKANQEYEQTLVRWVWIEVDVLPQYQSRVPVDKLGDLLKLNYGAIDDAKTELGAIQQIRETFIGFQEHLYRDMLG